MEKKSKLEKILPIALIAIGLIAVALFPILRGKTALSDTVLGILCLVGYVLLSGALYTVCALLSHRRAVSEKAAEEQSGGVSRLFRETVSLPYAVVAEDGKIVTFNNALRNAVGAHVSLFGESFGALTGISSERLPSLTDKTAKPATAYLGNRAYELAVYPLQSGERNYFLILFRDRTEFFELSEKYRNEAPVVAYLMLDNMEELMQSSNSSYRAEIAAVETVLADFAAANGAVVREYDRSKYLILMDTRTLDGCVRNKFDLLDRLRMVALGDDKIPVTASVGVAGGGTSLAAREKEALAALDMALRRGGDQAVVRPDPEAQYLYFGGKTKTMQKRSSSVARVWASRLTAMIGKATDVLIMGHANPDFDSVAGCVAMACLCRKVGVTAHIVVNTSHPNFTACTEKLSLLPEYRHMFVSASEGLALNSFGTLLIVVDANNFSILESPELVDKSFHVALIDHHIKKDEFARAPELCYLDNTASSASELCAEILEATLPNGFLLKEEANVMLAGIMVDTKNFTRTVGTRTFAAALYLRAAGGNTEEARFFFHEAFDEYCAEAAFGADVERPYSNMAIITSNGTGSPADRVAAAKAADRLLTVRGVDAAFALVLIGRTIHISARSNGKVNVQIILEKMGGGGHFDMAGAAISDEPMDEVKERLIAVIDSLNVPKKD